MPVELTLASGTWLTLYQRGWEEADDDSLAFLGGDDAVFAFQRAEELASYAVNNDDHHLAASPLWGEVRRRSRRDFAAGPEESYDLRRPSARGKEMLAELLVYLRVDLPPGDWGAEPLAALLPARHTMYGVPGWPDPRPTGGETIWEWLLAEADGRVGPPPATASSPGPASPGELLAPVPIESLVPGAEALWLGLDGDGAHTLLARDQDGAPTFLGEQGLLVAAHSADDLAALLATGDHPSLAAPPWSLLRGRGDIDVEPYEDNMVDLDELGGLIGDGLDRDRAGALLDARPLVQELATWLGLDEVVREFDEDQPLGRFFVRDLIDLATGVARASWRLEDVDLVEVRERWDWCVAELAGRISWMG